MKNSNIAVLISGAGSNFTNIFSYFSLEKHPNQKVNISLLLSGNPHSPALSFAEKHHIPTMIITKSDLYNSNIVIDLFRHHNIDLIVLAGFLWLIPCNLTQQYAQKIINIHPALLPKYGGKGMYGDHVHRAVWENKESETGITIHYVNEHYDDGHIIFQQSCSVTPKDTPESIAEKVHQLEYEYFPKVIEKLLLQ